MRSNATNAEAYLNELPDSRRTVISKLREVLLSNLPDGFEEVMNYGMLGYVVPHTLFPAGYHCDPRQPLPFINIASQKNHFALYHMALYDGPLLEWFKAGWETHSSKKLDMGKCCVRFKREEDVPFELIGQLAAKITPQMWIDLYQKAKAGNL